MAFLFSILKCSLTAVINPFGRKFLSHCGLNKVTAAAVGQKKTFGRSLKTSSSSGRGHGRSSTRTTLRREQRIWRATVIVKFIPVVYKRMPSALMQHFLPVRVNLTTSLPRWIYSLGVIEGLSLDNCAPLKVPQLPPQPWKMSECKTFLCALCYAMQKGRILGT